MVRAGGLALTTTVTSSNATAGQLVTTATVDQGVTVQIPSRENRSANTVATGGVAFDPLASGDTTVSATIPGFITTTNGLQDVTVGP